MFGQTSDPHSGILSVASGVKSKPLSTTNSAPVFNDHSVVPFVRGYCLGTLCIWTLKETRSSSVTVSANVGLPRVSFFCRLSLKAGQTGLFSSWTSNTCLCLLDFRSLFRVSYPPLPPPSPHKNHNLCYVICIRSHLPYEIDVV
jgi:hypothetical protein